MADDPYALLDVPKTADQDAIHAAYRRQMALYHPDKVASLGPELRRVAEERTKTINAAYALLGDPVSRNAYDRRNHAADPMVPPAPPPEPPEAVRPAGAVPPRPSPRKSRGPYHQGAMIASAGMAVFVVGVVLAGNLPDNPVLSGILGAVLNGGLIVIYAGLFLMLRVLVSQLSMLRTRHFAGMLLAGITKAGLVFLSGFLLIVVVFMLLTSFGHTDDRHFLWIVLGLLVFTVFAVLALATLVAPRWTARLMTQVLPPA